MTLNRIDTYLYETASNFLHIKNRVERDQAVEEALRSVGLSLKEIKRKYPHELSGGQVQRISVARALISNPSLLIADEPVSMVDASLQMSIVNLFKELKQRGVSIIYITHNLAVAYYLSDRLTIMLRGSMVETGQAKNVLENPMHPYARMLKESIPDPDPETSAWKSSVDLSTLESEEYAREGCKFVNRCPQSREICRDEEPNGL